jgi:hypothetical protein
MKINLLIAAFLISHLAFANDSLLNSVLRPSISDVKKANETLQIPNDTLVRGSRFNLQHFRTTLEQDAPQFIAKLEKANPNATFLFLGRDTQLISDVVNAFYLSIGQNNRVKQVGVSSPTLAGADEDTIMKYLEQFGISIENLKKSNRAMVLVDTISKGEVIDGELISGRQGRVLLQVVYKKWIEAGLDPKELVKKFMLVGMQVSTFRVGNADNNSRYRDISEISLAIELNQKNLEGDQKNNQKIGRNFVVPLIQDTRNLFNEAGYDHYTATWHDKYQPPILKDGKYIQNPGSQMPIEYRWSVLWMQKEIVNFVFTENFKNRVLAEGRTIDVDFDIKIDEKVIAVDKKINYEKELGKSLKQQAQSLQILGKEYNYDKVEFNGQTIKLTDNGSVVLKLIVDSKSLNSVYYHEQVLESLINLYQLNKIGSRDFKRLFELSLSLKDIQNQDFFIMAQKNYKKVYPLEVFLGKENERKDALKSGGFLSKNYQKIIDNLALSCQFIYGK